MTKYSEFRASPNYSSRLYEEKEHEFRSRFERDRDRILYSKAFRRLSGKTQVFVHGYDDHLRTRLTHTLEVSQISKTISNYLGLNNNLTEAISYGHDIGHTPFGHVGERTLNLILNGCDKIKDFNEDIPANMKGFKHNWQGIKVVSELEKINKEYEGLNLTDFTLWGILNHSKLEWGSCDYLGKGSKCSLRHRNIHCTNNSNILKTSYYKQYINFDQDVSWSIEGLIVNFSDEIAQRHHDIEDGLEAGIINKDELIEVFKHYFYTFLNNDEHNMLDYIHKENNKDYYIPCFSKLIINFYVNMLINTISNELDNIKSEFNINNKDDFHHSKGQIKKWYKNNDQSIGHIIKFDPNFHDKEKSFKKYLKKRILNSFIAQSMDGKSNFIIRQLIKAYLTNPQQLPDKTIITFYKNYSKYFGLNKKCETYYKVNNNSKAYSKLVGELRNELKKDHHINNIKEYRYSLLRTICDYIAGMTDDFAFEQYELLYGTKI